MGLITRILPPDQKGFKLTFQEMDNNLYYLQSLGVSGLTFSANTLTITNPTGGTKSVIINTGNTFTGGTVSGATQYTNGLSANTISATTYQNLPLDIRVTGGTYSAGTATFINNTGGTFNVTGFLTGVTDTYVTGGTYNNGEVIFTNNTGGTFNVNGFYTGETTSITGTTNVGTGINIFDSVVNRTLQINSITGDTLEKITTTLSANTIQVGINEENLTLWPLVVTGNRLIDGSVAYVSGLTFEVSPLNYIIDAVLYDTPTPTQVTLNSGDTIFDRIDVIFADISGNTGVLEGTPSANPEKPLVDSNSQVEVTFVSVPASSTTPTITTKLIYDENTGQPTEWNFFKFGNQTFRISGDSTAQSYSGSKSISVSGLTISGGPWSNGFTLSSTTVTDTNQYATLQFAIRNMSGNSTNTYILIQFLGQTGNVLSTSNVFVYGGGATGNYIPYNATSNVTSWQLISIPLWRFYLSNTNVYGIRFSYQVGSTVARHYFDKIELVQGTSSSPPTNSWTTIKGDGTTTITAPNPNSTLTISGGTNIGSTILGTSSVVLNLDNNIILTGVTANTVSATTYQNLPTDIRVTGASYSNNTFTYTNNTGGTFNTSFNTVTGLTVNGNLNVTGATVFGTISATTYQNLPIDVRVTGATYSNNTFTYTNNTGGTFNTSFNTVTGLTVNGNLNVTGTTSIGGTLTANTISSNSLNVNGINITGDTYVTGLTFNTGNYNLTIGRNDGVSFTDSLSVLASDLKVTGGTYDIFTGNATFTNNTGGTFVVSGFLVGYTDLLVTGATYNNNTFTFKNSSGGTFDVSFNTVTGITSTGTIQSSILSATTYQNLPDNVTGNYLPLSGGTVIGSTNFTNGLTANTISATTYQNLPDNVTGNYLPLSGGTLTGSTVFTNGLTANTISATTYQNLPIDIRVTGSTYSNNTFTYINNTGGTFSVLFNTVSGLTVNGDLTVTGITSSDSISATTYQNLPTDIRVTGGTYSAGTITFTNNTGGTFDVTGLVTGTTTTIGGDYLPLSGGTVTGQTIFNQGVTADTISATTYQNLPDNVTGNYLPLSGGTLTGSTSFTNGLTSNTISATTYQNLPISGLTEGNYINISGSNGNFTISVTGLTQGLSGEYLPLSGGTVSGGTQFTNGLSANTISATTYQNLPVTADTYVTGYTYNNNTFTIKQNNGQSDLTQTFNTVTGLTSTGTISSNTISATTYQNLPVTADTFVTAFTYSNNTFTINRNQGLTPLTSSFNTVTGLTVNGNLTVTGTTSSNTISATTYQNLPVTADTFVTAFTYSNNTFTIGRNQGLSALTSTIGSVTGLTSTGTISSSSLSATTLTVNGVSITGDTFVTGGTYSDGTITFRNNRNTTFPVTGFTTGVTITNNVNNYLLTATGTNNSINGEGNATFDGTTLDLKKNSTNPNIILSDTGGTSNDAYIRFEATSAGTPSYAIGVDKSDLNKLKFNLSGGGTASPSVGTTRFQITTGGTINIPFNAVPTVTIGSSDQIELSSTITSSQILLKNGSSGTLSSSLTQYASFSALEVNVGSTVANEEFYIVNESVSGNTVFRNNGTPMVVIYPTGRTDVLSGAGTTFAGNVIVDNYLRVGQLTGTGLPLYRNTTTGILAPTSSDVRLKQNVEQITNALDIVKNLRGVYYNWKDNQDFQSGDSSRQFGFIAQEVEEYLPEAVRHNGVKDYKTVKYSEMVSVLVEAMKEQQQQIESLKTEIQDLKNRISNIGE